MEQNVYDYLLSIGIREKILKEIGNNLPFDMSINTQGLLLFELDSEVLNLLDDYEIANVSQHPDSWIATSSEIMTSSYDDCTVFDRITKHARTFNFKLYTPDDDVSTTLLLCYLIDRDFKFQMRNILGIDTLTEPVPVSLFVFLLSNCPPYEVSLMKDGAIVSGLLRRMFVQDNISGKKVYVTIETISRAAGAEYSYGMQYIQLPTIEMTKSLSDFGIDILTPEMKEVFTNRGRNYVEINDNPTYLMYDGFAFYKGVWNNIREYTKSRVMVDINATQLIGGMDDEWFFGQPFDSNKIGPTVPEEKLWQCVPFVYGFSFGTKNWVQMDITNVSKINFSEDAFNELIIPPAYKHVFISCLTNKIPSLDMIENKGVGKVFLLYGPPGTGKTLTAESVAEYLKKPLYFVSVGELGLSPEDMESKLQRIMQTAASWDAVVLLDEVDVFAIKRLNTDIHRNAMTAILLRLLERFEGIIFMTTNLIDNLDEAFVSRATASIRYDILNIDIRRSIWTNLLSKASQYVAINDSVNEAIINNFGESQLNGRAIKNVIRIAIATALASPSKELLYFMVNDAMLLNGYNTICKSE